MRTSNPAVPRAKKKKVIYGEEYQLFLRLLRAARENAHLTQEQVAERLKLGQTYVSRCERGEHRVDIAELYFLCRIYGISFTQFAAELEAELRAIATPQSPSSETE